MARRCLTVRLVFVPGSAGDSGDKQRNDDDLGSKR